MKRNVTKLIIAALGLIMGQAAWAQTFTQGALSYTVTDADAKTVSVAKASTELTTGDVVVPATVTEDGVTYTVTSIAANGFNGAGNLTTVDLTATQITTVSDRAFYSCGNLTEVKLPSTVTSIGNEAFRYSSKLDVVNIPASVESIGDYAFFNTDNISTFNIADSDTPLKVGTTDDNGFPAKKFYFGRDIVNTDGTPTTTRLVWQIATDITIGPKVTYLGTNAFRGRSTIERFDFSQATGLTTLGTNCFYGISNEQLTTFDLTKTKITAVPNQAFASCGYLTEVKLPNTVTSIGNEAFCYSGKLDVVNIPASVESIGDYAFFNTDHISTFNIADSDTPLKVGTTDDCGFPAKKFYFGRDIVNTDGTQTTTHLVWQIATDITIGPKVTYLGANAFKSRSTIERFDFSQATGLTTLGVACFRDITNEKLTTIDLSATKITAVPNQAFYNCGYLAEAKLPGTVTSIGDEAFYYCQKLDVVTIPASVESIGTQVFYYTDKMSSFTIEDSSEPLKIGTFGDGLAGETFYLGRDIQNLDGTPTTSRIVYPNAKNVTLGKNVTTLNPYMFTNSNIETFDMSQATSITSIPERCFNNCDALRAFTIPANITTIEASAFWNMNGDMNLTIADSDEPLTINATSSYYPIFEYNNNTAYIGRNIVRTGVYENRALFNTSSEYEHHVTFGPKVTTIGDKLFQDCSSLISVDLSGSGVTSIGEKAFNNCQNLTSVKLNDKLTTMGDYVFQDCRLLPAISLPGTLKKVPVEAFENCFALATVTLGEGIEEIANGAFYDTDALTEITIPASVKKIGRAVFYCNNGQAMKRMVIADSDEPLEFANSSSEYNWGTGNLTDHGITLDYFYLGRDINRVDKTVSLVPDCKHIEIGPKVTTLDENLFYRTGDTSPNFVENVTVSWLVPITFDEGVFHSNTYANATLWLPGGTKEAYQAADYWKNFVKMEFSSYVITATSSANGTLSVGDITAADGTESTLIDRETDAVFTIAPAPGYEPTTFTVDGTATTLTGETYTIANLLADHDVAVAFTPIVYTLAYDLGGGSIATDNPATYTIETAAITLNNPTRTGYTFAGWTGTDLTAATKTVTIAKGSVGNRTYTATWTPVTYNITYDLAGGSVATDNPATYNIETAAITLNNPTRTGYNFAGWTGTDLDAATKTVTIAKGSTGNRTYTATWTPVTYNITYDLAGGNVATSNPATYTIETAAITLNNPTREHYIFTGWTGTGLTAASDAVTIAKGSTGNRTYTATWTEATYTVSITGAGVTASTTSPKYGESVVITIADDPDRSLATLTVDGTDVTASVSGGKYTIAAVAGNVTVVATFTATKEFITVNSYGIGTYSCGQDLDFTGSDLRAYIAGGYSKATNTVMLIRVYDVPAGTGIIIKGTADETYKIPYATTQAYYVNMLVGVVGKGTVNPTDGTMSNYVFNNGDDGLGFYTPTATGATVNNGAYLQVPTAFVAGSSKVRFVFEDEDDATGINDFEMYNQKSVEGTYNIGGQKLDGMQRGLNIVGGKKVLIK